MAKLVVRGEWQSEEILFPDCDCTYVFEACDVQWGFFGRGRRAAWRYFVTCSEHRTVVFLEAEDLPDYVKRGAQERHHEEGAFQDVGKLPKTLEGDQALAFLRRVLELLKTFSHEGGDRIETHSIGSTAWKVTCRFARRKDIEVHLEFHQVSRPSGPDYYILAVTAWGSTVEVKEIGDCPPYREALTEWSCANTIRDRVEDLVRVGAGQGELTGPPRERVLGKCVCPYCGNWHEETVRVCEPGCGASMVDARPAYREMTV